jgi:hypothetical protein
MDRAMMLEHLAQAAHHVATSYKNLGRQRALLAKFASENRHEEATRAAELLVELEEMQMMFIVDRDRLIEELGDFDLAAPAAEPQRG